MKKSFKALYKMRYLPLVLVPLLVALMVLPGTLVAATTPGLGQADSFAILSSTYTNTVGGTTITGDLGYTTGPAVIPTVNGTNFGNSSIYNQAGIDQGTALTALNIQTATYSFPVGPVDLSTDITNPNGAGIFIPGVYVIDGAASITAGITLNGAGTYIFRMTGALNTAAGSIVTLNGPSPCDVFWTPGAATTLGANSTFKGTDIDAAGITIGSTVNWQGRALAFGGTVSTATDTISILPCSTPHYTAASSSSATPTPTTASSGTLTVYKVDSDGNPIVAVSQAGVADFDIYTNEADIAANSPFQKGSTAIGTNSFSTNLQNGTYYVVEKSAPEGYDIDGTVRSVTISGGPASLTFTNTLVEVSAAETEVTAAPTTATTAAVPVTTTVTGGQLPKTGTPWYNLLLLGVVLSLIGVISWMILKKRAR